MALWDVVADLGDLVTDVGKDVGKTVVDSVDTPLIGLVNPGLGILAQVDEVVDLGGKLVDWANDIGLDKFVLAATSPILAAGQAAIADLRESTGSGQPEAGEKLSDSEQRFHQATEVLKSAHPGGSWTGTGSDAYSAADSRQEDRTKKLAALDQQLHGVIAREAGQIARTRAKLDDESNGLAEFGLTTIGYGLIPGVGPALKQAAELQAVAKALSECSVELQTLTGEVNANAAEVQQLAGQYTGCVPEQGAPYGGPPANPGPAPSAGAGPAQSPGGAGMGSGGGAGAGSGGGSGAGGGAPSAGTPTVPDMATQAMTEPATPGAASDRSGGGMSSGLGSLPSGGGGSPSGSGSGGGGLASLIAEVIKAATQHSSNPKSPEEQAAEDAEQKKQEEQAAKSEEAAVGQAAEPGAVPVAAAGDAQGGRAPVHVELDVDPARLDQPMTVTLDRDHPIVLPPATTT
jgi:EspA/EspE family